MALSRWDLSPWDSFRHSEGLARRSRRDRRVRPVSPRDVSERQVHSLQSLILKLGSFRIRRFRRANGFVSHFRFAPPQMALPAPPPGIGPAPTGFVSHFRFAPPQMALSRWDLPTGRSRRGRAPTGRQVRFVTLKIWRGGLPGPARRAALGPAYRPLATSHGLRATGYLPPTPP